MRHKLSVSKKAFAFLIQGLPHFLPFCFFLPQMQPSHNHEDKSHKAGIVQVGREESGSLKTPHEPGVGSLQNSHNVGKITTYLSKALSVGFSDLCS